MVTRTVINERGQWLDTPAAESFLRMVKAGCPDILTSAGRTTGEQQYLYDLYLGGRGNFALPPEKSWHVKGKAVDAPGRTQRWMVEHGDEHGWHRTNPKEPWHFDYFSEDDKHINDRERILMDFVTIYGRSVKILCKADQMVNISDAAFEAFKRAGIPYVKLPVADISNMRKVFRYEGPEPD